MPREKPRLYKEDTPKMKQFVLIDDSLTVNLVCNAKGDVVDIEYYHNDNEVLDALDGLLTRKQVKRIIEGEIVDVLAELLGIILVKEA